MQRQPLPQLDLAWPLPLPPSLAAATVCLPAGCMRLVRLRLLGMRRMLRNVQIAPQQVGEPLLPLALVLRVRRGVGRVR